MEFHIAREARERYGVEETLFNYVGNVVFGDVLASRRLAAKMTEVRAARAAAEGRAPGPEDVVNAGALFAMGLIDELSHALVARYRETVDPEVLTDARRWFAARATDADVERLVASFAVEFPNVAVYRGEETVEEWLGRVFDGLPGREAALEEMLLLWLANRNPAYKAFGELFDETRLRGETIYPEVTGSLDGFFATRPPFGDKGTLLDVLRAPMLASPESLSGQLDYIRERWVEYIGDELRQVLLAIDVLREEDVAIWMRFHPAGGRGPGGEPWQQGKDRDWGMFGFAGDEYRGFEDLRTAEERRRTDLLARGVVEEPTVHEYEAFSPDQAWMPNVVLLAKSTYVWLEQLSKQYGRHIHKLDQIPEEELRRLAGQGMNGLWLIGLWERSVASQTIKRMMGQHDAVASAYSLRDYRIAEDLGGEKAYEVLRDRARAAGIRLASDMVPNHMGIDSTWVIEHPDWFVSRKQSPFPVYRFEGPDLSPDLRVEIKIEDHYFDQTDAAVVFQLRQRGSGQTDYVYHGNDGTTFAWNDTAQLDYSKGFVREQVIQTILQVAKLFPIIRFDAAMTLAKKHVQRLWFPLPGEGRSIPSRAENAMTNAEFDALMPNEFWREVVDRVAVEVPGTLLLAEAFWLLEGYFVRTLGMHRVYNSAFMNMLRDEENAKYRSYLKKTIEFDPDILKRYVNFMSNPDERTAVDQFGSGDKYFGCCTLMATMPGLPMFGHGQVEAFTERYGMEYKRARMDETPNVGLVERHQREIMPLLKNRGLFAESGFFRMYDFVTEYQGVDENVFAFSNREGGRRAVILFNNAYSTTRGTIHWSVEQVDKGSGVLRGETLGDAIRLPWEDGMLVAYRDTASGLEYLRKARDLRYHGLTLDLRGYQYAVLLNWRDLRATAEQPWDKLCHALHGTGVQSLDETLLKLRVRPVHEALKYLLNAEMMGLVAEAAGGAAEKESIVAGGDPGEAGGGGPAPIADKRELDAALEEAAGVPDMEAEPMPVAAALPERLEVVAERAEAVYTTAAWLGEKLDVDLDGEAHPAAGVRAALEASLAGAVAMKRLDAAGAGLPSADGGEQAGAWAQVVAWSVLRHLDGDGAGRVVAFDRLQLRGALAESFQALGVEAEESWRGAARVRVLLEHGQAGSAWQEAMTAKFWEDEDVRWLAGVSEGEGKAYVNQERAEALLAWMSLPTRMGGGEAGVEQDLAEETMALAEAGFELRRIAAGGVAVTAARPGEGAALNSADESAVPGVGSEVDDTEEEAVVSAGETGS